MEKKKKRAFLERNFITDNCEPNTVNEEFTGSNDSYFLPGSPFYLAHIISSEMSEWTLVATTHGWNNNNKKNKNNDLQVGLEQSNSFKNCS